MSLKVYADRMSQPSRTVILFCKLNKIDFEEIKVDLTKRQHLSSEFAEINPLQKVPAIVDGRFKLSESHAILMYLTYAFPGVADHWYPADLSKRAKIHSVLDWHHLNLRYGAKYVMTMPPRFKLINSLCVNEDRINGQTALVSTDALPVRYVLHTTLAPALGRPTNPEAAAQAEKILDSSLSTIESVWLKGSGKFLLGSYKPSIADLSLICEIMQLEVVDKKDLARILSPYKKVQAWIEATKASTQPHFDEVHGILFRAKAKFQEQRENAKLHSKM